MAPRNFRRNEYAKFCAWAYEAMIRVYDQGGNLIGKPGELGVLGDRGL